MNGRYLLDTNIVIALFANEQNVINNIRISQEVFIPSIVIGELYFGAYRSSRADANIKRIEEFASYARVLNCDAKTAKEYGHIKDGLRQAGHPIPENDIDEPRDRILMFFASVNSFFEVINLVVENWIIHRKQTPIFTVLQIIEPN
jgi:tRNA(fMet)-specific endonuclease VapC